MKKKCLIVSSFALILCAHYVIGMPLQLSSNKYELNARSKSGPRDLSRLKLLEKKYIATRKIYLKSPHISINKTKFIETTYNYANTVLTTTLLPPKQKYPKALQLYKEIIKVDPNHLQAKSKRDLIENIYRSMGRPIPKT